VQDDAISVSLGLEGFTVLGTIESDDRVDVLVELRVAAGVCPRCAGVSTYVHDRTDVRIRDIAVHGKPTYLLWRKRRLRCEGSECERATFSEEHPEIPRRGRTTRRFRRHLARRARRSAVSHVASEEHASWWLVWRSVIEAPTRRSSRQRAGSFPERRGARSSFALRRSFGGTGGSWPGSGRSRTGAAADRPPILGPGVWSFASPERTRGGGTSGSKESSSAWGSGSRRQPSPRSSGRTASGPLPDEGRRGGSSSASKRGESSRLTSSLWRRSG